jgi:uncharacterized protein YceK
MPVSLSKSAKMILFGLTAWTLSGCTDVETDVCATGSIRTFEKGQGFELIDFKAMQVWGTADWTTPAFSSFDLPLSWLLWRKNDPRQGQADSAAFLRSPGCNDGQYTYMAAFGRRFLHVVDLKEFRADVGSAGAPIRAVTLTKHHQLHFEKGSRLQILSDPSGVRYLLVARTVSPKTNRPDLPMGWTIRQGVLSEPWDYVLDGLVKVLRLNNEDSYQGPLPAALDIPMKG